jgi:hypothetical protein
MKAKSTATGTFTPVPVGAHIGVCTGLYDIGTQGGGKFEPKPQLIVTWSLPSQLNDAGEPMRISSTYTSSMNKKANLRKVIESWFGKSFPTEDVAKDFDFKALLGRSCIVNVIHKESGEKTYANVSGVMPIPKGMQAPAAPASTQFYSPEDQAPDELSVAYANLPEWIRKKVDTQLPADGGTPDIGDTDAGGDDIPF